jgi:hypothetical protein
MMLLRVVIVYIHRDIVMGELTCARRWERGRGEGLYLIVSICHGKQMSRVKQLHITYRLYEDSHAEAPHRELPCCWRL